MRNGFSSLISRMSAIRSKRRASSKFFIARAAGLRPSSGRPAATPRSPPRRRPPGRSPTGHGSLAPWPPPDSAVRERPPVGLREHALAEDVLEHAEHVGLGEDADDAIAGDHRQGTDLLLAPEPRRVPDVALGLHGDDPPRHHVPDGERAQGLAEVAEPLLDRRVEDDLAEIAVG